jgi:hypothetical protein
MNVDLLASLLEYPEPWIRHGMLSAKFFEDQAMQFAEEHGDRKPSGGTEHWRYGGFLFWFRQALNQEQVQHLLDAALADPDPPMAGNILKVIASHPATTPQMLRTLCEAAAISDNYYTNPAELQSLYTAAHQAGGNAA